LAGGRVLISGPAGAKYQ